MVEWSIYHSKHLKRRGRGESTRWTNNIHLLVIYQRVINTNHMRFESIHKQTNTNPLAERPKLYIILLIRPKTKLHILAKWQVHTWHSLSVRLGAPAGSTCALAQSLSHLGARLLSCSRNTLAQVWLPSHLGASVTSPIEILHLSFLLQINSHCPNKL